MNIEQLREELATAKKVEQEYEEFRKSVGEWKLKHAEKLKQMLTRMSTETEELKKQHQAEKEQIQKKCVELLVQKDKELKKRDQILEQKIKEWKENQDKRMKEILEKKLNENNSNLNQDSVVISFPTNWFGTSMYEEEDDEVTDVKRQIQKKINYLRRDLDETNERLEQLRKANEYIPKFQQEIKQKTKIIHDLQKDLLSEKVKARKEKESLHEEDDKISIVKQREERIKLIKEIEKIVFISVQSDQFEIASLRGPIENGKLQSLGYSAGKTTSTYPLIEIGKRLGDPICDRFHFSQFKDHIIVAIADGCGWGPESMLAAATASDVFLEYMKTNIEKIKNSRLAAHWMIRAFSEAHRKIIGSRSIETIFTAGTTTMVAGIALQIDDEIISEKDKEKPEKSEKQKKKKKWGFTCLNLGDCKAYHRNSKTGIIKDITKGNRINNDPKDPGGRLGPQLKGGLPDIRNLKVHFWECEPGDTISLVSDGVHDCLDPEHLGYLPSDLGLTCQDNKWENLTNLSQIEDAKVHWTERFLTNFFQRIPNLVPDKITEELVGFAWQTTSKMREFMEQNKNAKQPNNYKEFPGKMDHTTCLTFTIGNGIDLMKDFNKMEQK